MFFVYVLYNKKTKKYYIGYTNNIERRLEQHTSGENNSTKYMCEYRVLLYYEAFLNKSDAIIREKKLKHHGSGLRKLKDRLEKSIDLLSRI